MGAFQEYNQYDALGLAELVKKRIFHLLKLLKKLLNVLKKSIRS